VIAQQSTPAAGQMMPAGVNFEPVAFATGVDLPSPADMAVLRFTEEPGASLPLEQNDPTGGLLGVESGTFTLQGEKEIAVSRGAGLSEAMATPQTGGEYSPPQEMVAAGEEVTLKQGDAAWVPGSVTGEIRNDGDTAATGIVFLVGPPGTMMGEATP